MLKYIKDAIQAEISSAFNWIPILLCLGILIYFILPFEPNFSYVTCAFVLSAMLLIIAFKVQRWLRGILAVCLIILGFFVANLRTISLDTYLLKEESDNLTIYGEVEQIQHLDRGNRLILTNIKALNLDKRIKKVRISVKSDISFIEIGDYVKLKAVLLPPPPPMVPMGFDFGRYLYFKKINAIGYAINSVEAVKKSDGGGDFWSKARDKVIKRTLANLDQPIAGIAAGILVGDASSIPKPDYEALRIAGIAHLLAISGMHLVVMVGIIFFAVRFCILQSEYLALRVDAKKIAAICALIGSFIYLKLALSPVSAQRAFIMASIVLLAIVFDKNTSPLRAIAIAAVMILLVTPEEVLNPSLQMSFVASLALITSYKWFASRVHMKSSLAVVRIGGYMASILFSTMVAGFATAPLIIYHFNQYSTYSVITNLLAIPINDFFVMPLGLLALILIPFELDYYIFQLMGFGVGLIYRIAASISEIPYASIPFAKFSDVGIFLIAFFGIIFMLMKTHLRFLFLPFIIFGIFLKNPYLQPDIIVAASGKLFAVRTPNGEMAFSSLRAARYIREIWQQVYSSNEPISLKQAALDGCTAEFCIYAKNSKKVLLSKSAYPEKINCDDYDVVINLSVNSNICYNKALSASGLKQLGNVSIWLRQDGAFILSTRELMLPRPWS